MDTHSQKYSTQPAQCDIYSNVEERIILCVRADHGHIRRIFGERTVTTHTALGIILTDVCSTIFGVESGNFGARTRTADDTRVFAHIRRNHAHESFAQCEIDLMDMNG